MSKKSLSRRDFLNLSAGTAAASVLAACGATPTPERIVETVEVEKEVEKVVTVEVEKEVVKEVEVEKEVEKEVVVTATPAPEEMVELSVWHVNEDELDPVISAFEDANPNITISFQYYPWGEFFNKLETAYAAGAPPDVHRQDDDEIPFFAQRGALLPLNDYFDQKVTASDLNWGTVESTMIDGTLYVAIPASRVGNLWYNKTVFEEAGIELPPATFPASDWTWDKFAETAAALTPGDGLTFGAGSVNGADFINSIGRSNGGRILDENCLEFLMNEPEMVEAMQACADMINVDQTAVDPETMEAFGGAGAMFDAGNLAMRYGDTRDQPDSGGAFEWDIAGLPVGGSDNPIIFAAIECYGVPQATQYPDQATDFAAYLMNDTAQLIFAKAKNIIPINNKATEIWVGQSPANRQLLIDAAPYGKTNPFAVAFGEVQNIAWPAIQEVMLGQKTAQEAMDEVKPLCDEVLQEVGSCLGA